MRVLRTLASGHWRPETIFRSLRFRPQAALEVLRHWSIVSGWHEEDSTHNKEVVETCLLASLTTSQHSKP